MRAVDILKIEDSEVISWISRQSRGQGKQAHYLTIVRKADNTRLRTKITREQAESVSTAIMLHLEVLLKERGARSAGALDVHQPTDRGPDKDD